MASAALNWDFRPRRGDARLRLGIPATLVTVHGHKAVTLINLSQTGARVRLASPLPVSGGILKWIDFQVFGSTTWQNGRELGISFEDPIDPDWLVATRALLPLLGDAKREARRFAQNWASGNGQPNKGLEPFERHSREIAIELDDIARRRRARVDWIVAGVRFLVGGVLFGIILAVLSILL